MKPALPFEGGCACGAVRYRVSEPPMMTFQCHCKDCQKASGGPFVAGVVIPRSGFEFTKGRPKYYKTPSTAGGNHVRGFCGDCGSRLTGGENDAKATDWVGIVVSSMDDPSWFQPQMHFFTSHAQPWDKMADDLPKYPVYPPSPEK